MISGLCANYQTCSVTNVFCSLGPDAYRSELTKEAGVKGCRVEPISIGGAWTSTPFIKLDDRGYFLEWFRARKLSEFLRYWPETAQAYCSVPRQGVVRVAHFAMVPPGQGRYVTCVSGVMLDGDRRYQGWLARTGAGRLCG